MRLRVLVGVTLVVGVVGVAVGSFAQGQGGPVALKPGSAVLLAEYECDPARLAEADQIFSKVAGPVLSKHVAAGRLLNWGYIATYIGGPANRGVYVWGADPAALVQARQVYLPEIQKQPNFADFSRICPKSSVTIHTLIEMAAPGQR